MAEGTQGHSMGWVGGPRIATYTVQLVVPDGMPGTSAYERTHGSAILSVSERMEGLPSRRYPDALLPGPLPPGLTAVHPSSALLAE